MSAVHSVLGKMRGITLLALAGAGVLLAAPAGAQRCLPSCDPADGRFLAIAGIDLGTLSPPELELAIAVPAGTASFDVGFFDGDGGEYDTLGNANWDTGLTALFEYTLYADPAADGTGTTVVEMAPGFPSILSNTLPDNAWADFTVSTGPEAATPSGNFFYVLKIRLTTPIITLNSFKVRTNATLSGMTLDPVERPFSYIAPWTAFTDLAIIYPSYPSATPTTYDGSFRFYFDVPVTQDEITIWDGDFDRGKFDLTEQDTDDLDTLGAPFLPAWSTLETVPEGVAVGGPGTGAPADDESPAGFGIYILRPPSVRYELTASDGQVFANDNPSGNLEWEQFRISTGPFDPLQMDHSAPNLPPGTYKLDIRGIDMLNLNALLLPFRVLCVDGQGLPCTPLRPLLIGREVFFDLDGNGSRGLSEPGAAGVTLSLYDAHGALLATAVTDADGRYTFPAESATYEVLVAASNFAPGGVLAGTASTTGGDTRTATVFRANLFTFNFGYRAATQTGTGTLGYWKNHPEAWPAEQITVGGVTYTKAQAISLMSRPGRGDKTYDLFKQLVAAKLNVMIGNDASCIQATIAAADAWMAAHPPGSNVRSNSVAWAVGGPLHQTLDDYNNGRLCAPHRD